VRGFFFFFALNRGGAVVFIEASFVFLVINILSGNYIIKNIPLSYWIVTGICAYLIMMSYLLYPQVTHYRWVEKLLRMLCLIYAIHCLSQKRIKNWVSVLFGTVLLLAVCWQLAAYYIFRMPYGTFSNPHIISNFTMLVIPLIAYFIFIIPGWYKLFFIIPGIIDIDFMIRTRSGPAIVSIIFAALFAIIFLIKDRRKWIGLLLICIVFVFLHISQYGNMATKVEKIFTNYQEETRWLIWSSSWNMVKDNSPQAWIVGNGIGGFRKVYPRYAHPLEVTATFPHQFLLEVLYQSGLIGMILVFGGIAAVFFQTVRSLNNISNRGTGVLIICLLVMLLSWSIHCGLTVHFYSKYSQYSLAFILGTILAILNAPSYRRKSNLQENGR
jgi:O-antigen ligase